MSADDFQTKYSSVMEAMLKSAVSETTKLFETMVNELKAELSKIKKENEDLKTRCSQFECERSQQTAFNRETGQSDGSEKRDTATQCDLVPFRTILVEQCQPLRLSSLQNRKQQCDHEEMEYVMKECNHETSGEGNSQVAFIHVKQEDHSSLQSLLEQEEIESTVVFGQHFSDKAESPWASTCGTEKEGPFINKVSSNKEILWPQRQEESQVIFELGHSVVVSLAETKGDKEEESGISQKISESGTQGELMSSETHQLLVSQPQSKVERFGKEQPRVINAQTDVALQQYADMRSTEEHMALTIALNEGEACCQLKNGTAEAETSSQSDFPVRRRRGRPPKKVKYPQQQVKEILQSPSSDFPTEQELKKSSTVRMKDISAVKRVNITPSESPQVCLFQPKESLCMITSSIQEKANTAFEDVDNIKMNSPTVTVASLSIQSYSTKEKTSESQQTSIDMEEGQIQAQSTEVSSAIETPITPSNESPLVPSVHSKEHHPSVTLQDAILLVEAMNQSMEENTLSPLRMTAAPQTQYVSHVDKVSAVQQTPLLSVATHDAVDNLPITELSTKMKRSAPSQTTDASPTNDAQAHFEDVIPKQQHVVSLSDTVSSTSVAATQTNVQSLQQHCPYPLITLVTPSRQDKTVPHKIIVIPRSFSSVMPHKISEQTSTKLPPVTLTAVVAQNDSKLSSSTSAGTPSLSSVPQKTMYIISSKLLPVVTQCNSTSADPQSGTQLHSKYTVKIPRQMSAVASTKHHSQTVVTTAQQESAKSAAPVMVSSSQLVSSPQELRVSQTALDEMASTSSEKRDDTFKNLLSSNQTAFVSEMKNAQTETSSSGKMSVGLVPTLMSSAILPNSEKKISAVVRLSRLPFSISTKESVLVSQLPTNGSFDSESVLKDTQHNTSSSVFISTQPSETHMLSTDICPSLKDTSVAVAVNTSQNLNKPNGIQEKATLSSENCITLDETPHSSCVQSSTRSKVSQPVFEKSTVAIDMKFSATSDTAADPTSKLPEEVTKIAAQQCALAKDHLIEEKQSSASLNPTSMALKDTSDPHLQMTKTQFLAQLAVSPVAQESDKASSFDSIDVRPSSAETSTSEMKKLKKNSIIALLGSHIKTHLQAKRTDTKSEPGTETETQTVSPKKPRLEDDFPNAKNTTSKPITQIPKNPAAEDVPSLKNTITDPTSIRPETLGPIENCTKPKRTVRDPSFVSSRRPNATCESAPVNHRRPGSSRNEGSRIEKSSPANPLKSFSSRDGVGAKNKKCTYLHPRKTCLTKDGASSKNLKVGSSINNTRTTSVRPKRTCMSRDGSCTKNTTSSSAGPATSGLTKGSTNPKIPVSESTSVIHRGCNFTEDGSSTEKIVRESNLYFPRSCSTTTTQGETNSSSGRSPKLAKSYVSHRKTEETTFKKQKLSQDGGNSEKNLRVVSAKLAEVTKAKGIAKMKRSNQSKLQDRAKTSQLAENNANPKDMKKYAAKAVWTPPKMLASETPPTGGRRSVHLPEKKEANFPRSQDPTIVYPPSVSLHPIPVRAPPIVSPLQPLSVIGWRLLKNQCGECGRVLSSSAALESHVSLHKGQRPFSCTLCGKHFPDSKGLKRHGRVHRNGRIHVCQKCGKGFVYRFCLTKHIQMVHSKIRPFVCQICDKGFFTKRDVEAHIRLHTGEKPFHCNLCEKKFARRVELNMHLRWHNGEKRHWCPYCGKGFLDFNNLKRHKYVHTGEKPHSCPHCPKSFKQSGHLKKHVRNVHKVL